MTFHFCFPLKCSIQFIILKKLKKQHKKIILKESTHHMVKRESFEQTIELYIDINLHIYYIFNTFKLYPIQMQIPQIYM